MQPKNCFHKTGTCHLRGVITINTLRTGEADLRLCITTVQDGRRKSAFLTRAWFPRTTHLNGTFL